MNIPDKLKSRKLWVALVGVALPPILSYLSNDLALEEALRLSMAAIIAYCVSQGYVDGKTMEGWIPDRLQAPDEE
tara:strand:- start:166 stop:390 length:225 start_codon:yes stop_codon:yes gene_type:complete